MKNTGNNLYAYIQNRFCKLWYNPIMEYNVSRIKKKNGDEKNLYDMEWFSGYTIKWKKSKCKKLYKACYSLHAKNGDMRKYACIFYLCITKYRKDKLEINEICYVAWAKRMESSEYRMGNDVSLIKPFFFNSLTFTTMLLQLCLKLSRKREISKHVWRKC